MITASKNAFLNHDWRRLPSASPDTFFFFDTGTERMEQRCPHGTDGPCAWCGLPHRAARRNVLVVDMCNVHLADEVFQAMRGEDSWPLLVPANGTWLLQPLGLAVFRLLKQALRRLLHMELHTAKAKILMRNGFSTSSMGFRLRGARP